MNIEIAFGIVEIICGLAIVYGIFVTVQRKTIYNASMVIFIFWTARVALSKFIWGNVPVPGTPAFITWLLVVCAEAVIASAVLTLAMTYKKGAAI